MALTFNGTSPKEIVYNGTNLTVLKYGSTSIWGKPYTLTITDNDNATITVSRTSSPNQHASTGTVATGTNVIYHGDILKITVTPNSGYILSSFRINDIKYTSSSITKTVTGGVRIEDVVVFAEGWNTLFTGSSTCENTSTTEKTVAFSPYIIIPSTGVSKIRVTGKYKYSYLTRPFSNVEINVGETYEINSAHKIEVLAGFPLRGILKAPSTSVSAKITITQCDVYYG